MMKKLILAAAGLALSAPAFADRGHRERPRPRHGTATPPPASWSTSPTMCSARPGGPCLLPPGAAPGLCGAQRPPPPTCTQSHSNAGPALVVGAILGGAIVHSVVTSGY